MTTSLTQQTTLDLNAQYLEYKPIILSLEKKLKQHVNELVLPQADLDFAMDYIEDHVTLFRFLKDSEFDETLAFGRLMDAVLWRKEVSMDQIKWDTIHSSFFKHDHPAFAFFHKQDRFGRPVAVIRMRHFPDFGGLALSDTIPPFACLVMEIARKWTRDLTRRNEQQWLKDTDNNSNNSNNLDQNSPVLISQIVVVIDISKSPMVPLEKRLIQELRNVTDDRFPGFFGSIYVMNFGWMYQGLWQMVKLLLSERAKSKINFPLAKEVIEYIPEENLLQELGGVDDYEWTLDSDTILQKYGSGWKMKTQPTLSPPTSSDELLISRSSRSLSLSSLSSFSSDDFFDALESPLKDQQQKQQSQSIWSGYSSIYGTPGTLTPIGIRSPSMQSSSSSNRSLFPAPQPSTNRYFHLTGIHIPSFIATIFGSSPTFTTAAASTSAASSSMGKSNDGVCGVDLTYRLTNLALEQRQDEGLDNLEALVVVEEQQQQIRELQQHRREPHFPHLLPADDPHSAYASAPLKLQIRRSEQRLIRITRRLFRLSFAYNGTLYWVILYIFLRGPAENSMKRLLAKMITDPRTMTYTTVGLTASLAGVLGASLSASLGQ